MRLFIIGRKIVSMPANSDAALADESADYSYLGNKTFPDSEFVTRTEFELALKQLMARFIEIQIRSHKNDIGALSVMLKDILKH